MKVLKFGGTSVGSAQRMKEVAKLITDGEQKIVVLSAMSGTTNTLVEQMAEQWGVTEKLKMQDQMEWVRRMNTIKNVAEENILKNGVYK